MADRRPGPTPSARPARHRVARGASSYRPVRTPLVSMGPSLVEERRRRRAYHRGLLLVGAAIAVAVALLWLVVLLGREVISGEPTAVAVQPPTLPVGRPEPQALARVTPQGSESPLKLQLPISPRAITAIGYNRLRDSSLQPLEPEGDRSNLSFAARVFRRFLATEQPTALRYFRLADGELNVVDVGAAPGTDVYAPISGTVIAIADNVIDNQAQGAVVQLQPLGDGETIVVLRNIDAAQTLAVGQTVSEGSTQIGTVRDMGSDVQHPLARYSHDAGSNLEIYVRRVHPDLAP